MASEIRPATGRAPSPEELRTSSASAGRAEVVGEPRSKPIASDARAQALDTVRLSAARVLAHQTLPEDESAESSGNDPSLDESDLNIIA